MPYNQKQTSSEEYKLYGGKVVLKFDPKKHIYTVNDKIIYGTTSITNVLAKPALINWAVKLTKEKILSEENRLGSELFIRNLQQILFLAGREHYTKSKEARDLGTRVHDKAEKWFAKGTDKNTLIRKMILLENQEERYACSAMLKFFSEHKFEPIELEGKCYSKKHGYAGTIDYYGGVDGKLSVLDYKTSSGIYPIYPLQTTAYANAKKEEGFKVDQTIIARFGKDGTLEIKIEKDWEKHLPTFLAAKVLKEYEMNLRAEEFKPVEKEPEKAKKVVKEDKKVVDFSKQ